MTFEDYCAGALFFAMCACTMWKLYDIVAWCIQHVRFV